MCVSKFPLPLNPVSQPWASGPHQGFCQLQWFKWEKMAFHPFKMWHDEGKCVGGPTCTVKMPFGHRARQRGLWLKSAAHHSNWGAKWFHWPCPVKLSSFNHLHCRHSCHRSWGRIIKSCPHELIAVPAREAVEYGLPHWLHVSTYTQFSCSACEEDILKGLWK